jgi:fucose permease
LRHIAFQLSMFTMLFFGMLDMSRGIAAPLMQHDWRLSYLQLGYAFAANSLGYLTGSFMSGFVADKRGMKPVLVIGCTLTSCGLALIVGLHAYFGLIVGFLCMGLGNGWLEIAVNSVVPAISKSSEDQAAYFNVLHGFYGVGAFGFPVAAVWLIRVGGAWRFLYDILLGISVLIFILGIVIHFWRGGPAQAPLHKPQVVRSSLKPLLRNPVLYLLLCGITAYVMAEGGIGSWLPTYLVQVRKLSVTQSSLYLSGFYFTFTLGRLSGKFWVSKLGDYRAVLICTTIAFCLTGISLWIPHTLFSLVIAGAGFSIVFPTIASIASHTFADHAGKVLGFLFTAGGTGSLLINGLIGFLATQYGLAVGFSTVLFFLLLVIVSIGAVRFVVRPQRPSYTGEMDIA